MPFDIAAQAAFTPTRILANLTRLGQRHRLPPRAARDRDLVQGKDYVLQPATLVLPQGSVDLSGRYGATIEAHARLDGMDLSIAQAFAPTLGLGGRATGTLDLTMPASVPAAAICRPAARGSTSPASRAPARWSSPIRSTSRCSARSAAAAAQLNALIRRGGGDIGRVQVRTGAGRERRRR